MLTLFTTLAFSAVLWLAVTALVASFAGSRAKIARALRGLSRPSEARARPLAAA